MGTGSSCDVNSAKGWQSTVTGTCEVLAVDGYDGTWFVEHRMNSQEHEPLSTMVHTVPGAGGTWYFVVSSTFPPSSLTDSGWPIGLGTSSGFIREDEELFPELRSEREPRGEDPPVEILWLALAGDDAFGVPPTRKLLSEPRF